MKIFADFHNAILADDVTQIASSIKLHPRLTQTQQFAVYSDGYRIRLVQAIRSDYPILLNLLGDKKFDDLASSYIEQYPPKNYNLDYYPHKFAEFVNHHYPDKFSGEVAILEFAIAEVFMIEDSESLEASSLSEISLEDFGLMTLKFRTACRLLNFSFQTSDYLTSARANENTPQPTENSPSWLILVRHNNEVHRHNLSEQEFSLLQNLASGKNLSDALEKTISKHESHAENIINNLQTWFASWIKNGIFCK